MSKFTLIAKTLFGLENVLALELRELGATDIEVLNRAVQFSGDQAMMYRANLHLRTALKILKPIASFEVNSEAHLYKMVRGIDWSAYMTIRQTFAIDGVVNSERFTHSKFIALKTKDAIADQFREKTKRRPSVDTRKPDLRINVHIFDRTCTISLDSSGKSLDRRGYRLARTEAPINEVLAAGILKLIEWDGHTELVDPMCGSGTFLVEAAMIQANVAPGRLRHFAFEKWNDFDRGLWKKIKDEADEKILQPKYLRGRPQVKIYGFDLEQEAISIAKENAMRAEVDGFIAFKKADFFTSKKHADTGLIVMNPPYGERLEKEEIENFYREIGTQLKHQYEGWGAAIISGNIQALKRLGLRPSKKWPLFNGAIECRLCKYELFKGKRKERLTVDG